MLEIFFTDNQIQNLGRISIYIILCAVLYKIIKHYYYKNVRLLVWIVDLILLPYWFLLVMFKKTDSENFVMLYALLRCKPINKIANKLIIWSIYLRLYFANYSSQCIENELTHISNKINKKSEN